MGLKLFNSEVSLIKTEKQKNKVVGLEIGKLRKITKNKNSTYDIWSIHLDMKLARLTYMKL